jgi:hypothetical protein
MEIGRKLYNFFLKPQSALSLLRAVALLPGVINRGLDAASENLCRTHKTQNIRGVITQPREKCKQDRRKSSDRIFRKNLVLRIVFLITHVLPHTRDNLMIDRKNGVSARH